MRNPDWITSRTRAILFCPALVLSLEHRTNLYSLPLSSLQPDHREQVLGTCFHQASTHPEGTSFRDVPKLYHPAGLRRLD